MNNMRFSPRSRGKGNNFTAPPQTSGGDRFDNFDDFDDFDDAGSFDAGMNGTAPSAPRHSGFSRRGQAARSDSQTAAAQQNPPNSQKPQSQPQRSGFSRRGHSAQRNQPQPMQASPNAQQSALPQTPAQSDSSSIKALYRPRKPLSVPDEQRIKPGQASKQQDETKKPAAAPDHPYDDWGEVDPRSAGWKASAQTQEKDTSFIGRIKAFFVKKRPQPDYYIPADTQKYLGRTRYKTRNHKPVPMWARAALTTLCVTAFFTGLVCLIFSLVMGGRVNYTGDGGRTAVRISGDERNTILLEQTEELENTSEFTEPYEIAPSSKDVEVILVASSSTRLDATASSQCDALMLVALDYKHKTIKLVPIMRDLYVRIEGYLSNRISRAFYYDAASGSYSFPTLKKAVEDNLGITPDHLIVVDSNAFITLVTRLGGVSMVLSEEEALYMSTDEKYGYFPRYTGAGEYLMTGPEALNYVRMKKVGNGEYDRTVRQRAVLGDVFKSINDMSFVGLCETAYAVLPLLPTDLTAGDMLSILVKARSIADYEVTYLTIPITGAWREGTAQVLGRDIEVMVTDFAFTADALQKYLYEDDQSYINGTAASGITIPDVAPYNDPNPPVPSDSDVPADEKTD